MINAGTTSKWARRRSVLLLCGLVSVPISPAPAAGNPVKAEMAALEQDVKALRAVRDRLLEKVRAGRKEVEPAMKLELSLQGLISRGDGMTALPLALRHSHGKWLRGRGRPGAADFIDPSGLVLKGKPHMGRLTGDVKARIAPSPRGKPYCEQADVIVSVNAKILKRELNGHFDTAGHRPIHGTPRFDYNSGDGNGSRVDRSLVPAIKEGTVSGRLLEVLPGMTVPAAPELDIVKDTNELTTHKRAQWHDAVACALYRQIHACALALDRDIVVAHALELTPKYVPVWPGLTPMDGEGEASGKQPPKLPDSGLDDDLDLGLEYDDQDSETESKKASVVHKKQQQELRAALQSIRSHVKRMLHLARSYRPAAGAAQPVIGSEPCTDSDFGPWFGEAALPSDAKRPNILPAAAGSDGPQEWQRIGGWRFVGPFPALSREQNVVSLPELAPAFEAGIAVDPVFPGTKDYSGKRESPAQASAPAASNAMLGLGCVLVPKWRCAGIAQPLVMSLAAYGGTEVFSPDDREAWLGINIRNNGALWINDKLVWTSPALQDLRSVEERYLFRARFTKGINRLSVRVDSHAGDAFLALRVCTRGQPRPAAEVKAHRSAIETAYEKLEPAATGIRGWRGDWTGKYPNARAPLAWDTEQKINVLWEIPLALSHSTPVIVGNKLFVCEDPQTLVCLNKMDGSVLWKKEADIVDLQSAEIQARIKALRKKGQAIDRNLLREMGVVGPAWGDWTGHTFPTPVTDGKHIWIKFNTGVLACFDLDGKRKWMVKHGGSTGTNAHIPSPVLFGGKLVVLLPKGGFATAHDLGRVDSVLAGYDAATGRHLWTADTARGLRCEVTGTPLPLRLTNGRDQMDVVVTPDGTVVRVDDGKVLRMYLGTRERYGSPTWGGANRVFISGANNKACYELIMHDRDHVGAKLLWHVVHPSTLYDSGDFQLLHGDLLYAYGSRLDVLGADTGEIHAVTPTVLWRRPGRCYSPLALAGDHLYVADLGNWFGMKKSSFHHGAVSVLTVGRNPIVLARNRIGKFSAAPAFDGDRIYLRHWYSLMCIGYTGEKGRVYEAETVAREALSSLFPGRPAVAAAVKIKAAGTRGATPLLARRAPASWTLIGPVPESEVGALRAALLGSDLSRIVAFKDNPGLSVEGKHYKPVPVHHVATPAEEYGIMKHVVSKVGKEYMERKERRLKQGEPPAWRRSVIEGDNGPPGSDLVLSRKVLQAGTACFFLASIGSDMRRVMRLDLAAPGTRAWLSGTEVRHNQLVDLPAGCIPMVIEVTPGDTSEQDLVFAPRFWPSLGGEQDLAEWLQDVKRRRPYLENVIKLSPAGAVAKKAKTLLASVDG